MDKFQWSGWFHNLKIGPYSNQSVANLQHADKFEYSTGFCRNVNKIKKSDRFLASIFALRMKRLLEIIVLVLGIALLAVILLRMTGILSFSRLLERKQDKQELIQHFKSTESSFTAFADYLLTIKKDSGELYFSLYDNRAILLLGANRWSERADQPKLYYDFNPAEKNWEKEILPHLGWDSDQFQTFLKLFKETGCESVKTFRNQIELGYKSGIWVSYGYRILPYPISDSLQKQIGVDSGIQILNPRVILVKSISM